MMSSPPFATQRGPRPSSALARIAAKVEAGERVTPEEALELHEHADLITLGRLADLVRARLHPHGVVSYIVDRNVNPTNVCITDCGFCAFYRRPDHPEAYVLPREVLIQKVQSVADLGGRQVLMQGGHHPYLKTDWWCGLFADLHARFPLVNLHALSAPELDHLAKLDKRPVEHVIAELKQAGLGSVPGAGAEVLVERVRKLIAPKKTTTARWLEVHRKVHEAGLRSTATLMYGHFESAAERVEHLRVLRELQDETGGFMTFIPLRFHPENTPIQRLGIVHGVSSIREIAVGRLLLDNVRHVKTYWIMTSLEVAQICLTAGSDDIDGTVVEEKITHMAGARTPEHVTEEDLRRCIEEAGRVPYRRDTLYNELPYPAAPRPVRA